VIRPTMPMVTNCVSMKSEISAPIVLFTS